MIITIIVDVLTIGFWSVMFIGLGALIALYVERRQKNENC